MKYLMTLLAAAIVAFAQASTAQAPSPAIGVVIMHGKGGSPTGYVSGLAAALEQKGYVVANLEMPWSAKREYDADVDAADREVDAALASLRAKGAGKVFVAGHSQGGLFAIHYGGGHPVDGIIAIAPGGNVANPIYRRDGWVIFLISWFLFYAGNFNIYQNIAVVLLSFLVGIAILAASWASWGVKYGWKYHREWENYDYDWKQEHERRYRRK